MAEPQRKPLTWDAYLDWEGRQPLRYELIDGQVYAMGGGTLAHDASDFALHSELSQQLRGTACRRGGPNVKVQTGTGNGRYPDALIDCGRFVPDALQAQQPTAVFEVLSRTTAWKDQNIQHYVLIFQDEIRVMVYTRAENGRLDRAAAIVLTDLRDIAVLPATGISLPLSALYQDLDFTSA
jgi:Uma2 family endonuclease